MRKKWSQLVSLVLVLMLLMQLVPNTALAASKIVQKSGAAAPEKVFTGQSYTLKVSGSSVTFAVSNKKVATIGATTGKFKPIAPGTTTVSAKDKRTGKVIAKHTFKVMQRSTAVAADVETLYLLPGESYTLSAQLTPSTSTDVVRFATSDKSIATVGLTSGKVTAVAMGETTITLYAKETAATANNSKMNRIATVRVIVQENPLTAVVSDENQITVTFDKEESGITAGAFSVVQRTKSGEEKTLSIVGATQQDSRTILLTLSESVFSTEETSTATLFFTSPIGDHAGAMVDLGTKHLEPRYLAVVRVSGSNTINEGQSGSLQFYGYDQFDEPYPLNNAMIKVYNAASGWIELTGQNTVLNVDIGHQLRSDGSRVVTFTAPENVIEEGKNSLSFNIRVEREDGSMAHGRVAYIVPKDWEAPKFIAIQ